MSDHVTVQQLCGWGATEAVVLSSNGACSVAQGPAEVVMVFWLCVVLSSSS